jgi:prevent-host-death family protein
MPEVTATDAARRFSDLLDSVEHDGEHYTIIRHGRAFAQIDPVSRGRGSDTKDLLRRSGPDPEWATSLDEVRALVAVRRSGRPRGAHDLVIAATARASKRTVVTSDLTAFTDLPGVTVLPHR